MEAKKPVLTATISSEHANQWDLKVDYDAVFSVHERPGTFRDWYTLNGGDTRYGEWQDPGPVPMPSSGKVHRTLTHRFNDPVPGLFATDMHQAELWMQNTTPGAGLEPEIKAALFLYFQE